MHHTTRRLRRRRSLIAQGSSPSGRGRVWRARSLAPAVLVMTLAATVAACAGGGEGAAPGSTTSTTVAPGLATVVDAPVPATLPVPENFVPADTRGVRIPPVLSRLAGRDPAVPTLPVEGGTAKIEGRVLGPDGPVEGATVRLERFVGDEFGILDVGTDEDGKYVAANLLGGRYRLRAWQKPSLATLEPPALFLAADNGAGVMDIYTEKREGVALQGALNTAEPHVGETVTFQALLFREEVDDAGIVRGAGIDATDVQLTPVGGLALVSPDVLPTNPDGFALFEIKCTATGAHSVVISSGDLALAVGLPECLPGVVPPAEDEPGPTTTTVAPAPTTTAPAPTTTARRPTTTTAKPSTTTTAPGPGRN